MSGVLQINVGISIITRASYNLITDAIENITWTSSNAYKLYVPIKHTQKVLNKDTVSKIRWVLSSTHSVYEMESNENLYHDRSILCWYTPGDI